MKHQLTGKIEKISGYSSENIEKKEHYIAHEAIYEQDNELKFLSFLEDPVIQASEAYSVSIVDEINSISVKEPDNKTENRSKTEQNIENTDNNSVITVPISSDDTDVDKILNDFIVDLSQLSQDDLKALQMLVQMPGLSGQSFYQLSPSLLEQFTAPSYKSLNFSGELHEILEKAYKAQRPVRVNLNDNTFIILRLIKNGQVSAEFIPGNKADEIFFQQNLQELKNRLEAKQLPYGELIVKHRKHQQEERKRDR